MLPFRPLLRRITHGLTLGVRTIVRDEDGHVLLVRHGYAPGWHLPGGGVDAGESAEAAARRELLEETNVSATAPLVLHGLYFNARFGGRDHVACFLVPAFSRGPTPKPNAEIREIAFFPLEAPPADTSPGTARRLAEVRGEMERTDRW
ncbi:NUDIX domain-containing protein [Aquabacter sp. L1I39]|uniref:NUDIX domain-containing protein n=1 Tax=Aquabacter sp. L1I39 TaxID=2820278 RepID=UPI001AD9B594|nr:NUDIX domain-containing protein [Aquabacter sp. L1I39]QTL01841.1 NUDIX domain-containing protein [Aquabacter sp. L1I39]